MVVKKLEINGQTLDNLYVSGDFVIPAFNMETETETVKGRPGSIMRRRNLNEYDFELELVYRNKTAQKSAKEISDEVIAFINHGDDEARIRIAPEEWFWYGYIDGPVDMPWDVTSFAEFSVNIKLANPYKYSHATYNNTAISDVVDVVNEGTAPTDITVEARALEDSTSYMITKGDSDYFMVGEAEDTEQETKDLTPFKYNDEFNQGSLLGWQYTRDGWDYGDALDGGDVSGGRFTFNPNSLMISEWGRNPNTAWHGASVQKSIGQSLQDFNLMFKIGVRQSGMDGPGKTFTYLYDEDNNIQFSIGYANTAVGGNMGAVVVNAYNVYGESTRLYTRHTRNQDKRLDDMAVFMEIERRGDKITITSYKYDEHGDPSRRNPLDKNTETFTDAGEHYQRKVRLSHIYSAKNARYDNFQRHFILGIYIQELLTDDDAIPILIKAGDLIYIDTEKSYVSINEEPRTDVKDFGSNYFKVDKGLTTLLIEPQGIFDTTVRWHDRYM